MPAPGWTVVPEAAAGWTPVAEPTPAQPQQSRVGRAWDTANTPLLPIVGQAARAIANHLDTADRNTKQSILEWSTLSDVARNLWQHPTETVRGAVAGMVEGGGNIVESMTSPVGIALTLSGLTPDSAIVKEVPALKGLLALPKVQALQRAVQGTTSAAMVTHGGSRVLNGDVAGGLGEIAGGSLGGISAATPRTPKPQTRPSRLTPAEQASNAFAEREGVPLDAATATGSRYLRNVQKRAANSLGAEGQAEALIQKQAEALSATGQKLAKQVAPNVQGTETGYDVGAGIRDVLTKQIRDLNSESDAAYSKVRAAEDAQIANAPIVRSRTVEPSATIDRLSALGERPSSDAVARVLYDDAVSQGYGGTFREFQPLAAEKIATANGLREEMASMRGDYNPRSILEAVADEGGISLAKETGLKGEIRRWLEGQDRTVVKGRQSQETGLRGATTKRATGGLNGVRGVVFPDRGHSLESMAERLRESYPEFRHISGPSDLADAIETAATWKGNTSGEDLAQSLEAVGAGPGTKWWSGDVREATRATTEPQPSLRQVPSAVRLTEARSDLAPLYQSLKREAALTPLMGGRGRLLVALDKIMQGPDVARLSDVDSVLSDLKDAARADIPELRTKAQGGYARAVSALDRQVTAAAERGGVLDALKEGRAATALKYQKAATLDLLSDNPQTVFESVTRPGNKGLSNLIEVRRQTPDQIPNIGRAVVSNLVETAFEDGKLLHAQKASAGWNKMSDATKAILFPDPNLRKDLGDFFLLMKRVSENPNPSGTATTLGTNLITQAMVAPVGKLLYSPGGVRFLTAMLRQKAPASAAARTALAQRAGVAAAIAGARSGGAMPVGIPVMAGQTDDTER